MNKEIYTNTCVQCGDRFDTYHKDWKLCPACEEEFKAERRESIYSKYAQRQKRGRR